VLLEKVLAIPEYYDYKYARSVGDKQVSLLCLTYLESDFSLTAARGREFGSSLASRKGFLVCS
jgi:hypothetical protein